MVSSRERSKTQVFRETTLSGDLQSLRRAFEVGGVFKRLWLSSGVAINHRSYPCGTTALMDAASAGHLDIVEYLLSKKADVHLKDYNGKTALHHAVLAGSFSTSISVHNPLVQALADVGVDIDAADWNNVTALDLACEYNNVSAASTLRLAGAREREANRSDIIIKQVSTISNRTAINDHIKLGFLECINEVDIENELLQQLSPRRAQQNEIGSDDWEEYDLIDDSPQPNVIAECGARIEGTAPPRRLRRRVKPSPKHSPEMQTRIHE